MKQKNPYFYTNLLAWGLVLFLIGNYVFGWTTPTADPPSSNLPAPINVGSLEQTKTGNLIIEGVLRLGQFTTINAPSGTEGALYYDTTENITKIYSSSAWGDLGGGAEPGQLPTYTTAERDALSPTLGQQIYNADNIRVEWYIPGGWTHSLGPGATGTPCGVDPGSCISGYCVDGYCCDVACDGLCETCSALKKGTGSDGICGYVATGTDPNYDCIGNCDVCSSGNCVADNSLCANTIASCGCSGSGIEFNCQTCTTGIDPSCGYVACSNHTCIEKGAYPDESGTINGDIVYCDTREQLWTPTFSSKYNWDDSIAYCVALEYASFDNWHQASCADLSMGGNCQVAAFIADACGAYPCVPPWDVNAPTGYYQQYWTSTACGPTQGFFYQPKDIGARGCIDKGQAYYLRCYRASD